MLIDRRHFAAHRSWLLFVLAATIAAAAWYTTASLVNQALLGGSSAPGLAFGIIGGLLILFEFALWPRKKVRAWRIGRAQTWMRAHIWLGLLTAPLIVLHTGFRLGGTLPTVLTVLFTVVIVSGVLGLWMQQIIPRMMLDQVAAETIYTQVDRVSQQLANEAEAIVRAVCGDPAQGEARRAPTVEVASVAEVQDAGGTVYRPWQVKTLERQIPVKLLPDAAGLADFCHQELKPFLRGEGSAGARLAHAGSAAQVFEGMRRRFGSAGHPVVNAFEELSRQRRDLDTQLRLHGWLHTWLAVHLSLSAALVVLMFVHIYTALRYW
ncbi:MAG: hypothetical protein WD894_06315 [Pirellulales bacterium]